MEAVQNIPSPMNVVELFPLHDTVHIGNGATNSSRGNFEYFSTLAQANKISFFNVRNRSISGEQICNVDNSETMPYPYRATSIGVELQAPSFGASLYDPQNKLRACDLALRALWASLIDHMSVELRVSQDIRLTDVVSQRPSGFGADGEGKIFGYGHNAIGIMSALTNGDPEITNRNAFKTQIDIPRGCNWEVIVEFSPLGKKILTQMIATLDSFVYDDKMNEQQQENTAKVLQWYGIRVTVTGTREVQQRGQLHY